MHIELEGLYLKLSARIHSGLKQEDGEEERRKNKERANHASREFPVMFFFVIPRRQKKHTLTVNCVSGKQNTPRKIRSKLCNFSQGKRKKTLSIRHY